jgi:hypothetical protein
MKPLFAVSFTLFLALASLVTAQESKSWPDTIANVEALLEQYIQKSDELLREEDEDYRLNGGHPLNYFGVSCANCYWPEHQCAILGRMLGKAELIKHLEKPLPPLTSTLGEVLPTAESLDQWVFTAKRLLGESNEKRASIWNLECVGNFGIPSNAVDDQGLDSVSFRQDGAHLWVYGDIVQGFYEQFVEVLNQNPEVTTVGLGSGGGSVRDAILAGSEIRKRGLNTQLIGPCLSACPMVFIGGVSRNVMRPFPPLGFHQMYSEDGAVPLGDQTYQLVADYAWSMGVDGTWFVLQMAAAEPTDMNMQGDDLAERDELCVRGAVTWYQGIGSTLC